MTTTVSERATATIRELQEREQPLSEQFRLVAKRWVDAEAAYDILNETKTAVFAQKCAELGDIAVNRAEQKVRSSPDWFDHLTKISSARRDANLLKMQIKYIEMKHREWVSANATNRAEMGMR
jgi:hypothetical protein